MVLFERKYLEELLLTKADYCLSLYQPTHRHHPDNAQDPIRFQNLIKELEASSQQKLSQDRTRSLLKPFEALAGDSDFWNKTLDGLAVFATDQLFRVYILQRPIPELAIVADNFHVKPLQHYLQATDRFQVLGLTLNEVLFYEGNRDLLDEVELPGAVPKTIQEALGSELTDEHITVATYGGKGPDGTRMQHGHGSKKDEKDVDAERFFRSIDRAITEHCSRPSGLPLILAALPEHHSLFQSLSHNPYLIKEGININPKSKTTDELRALAWKVWEPQYLKNLEDLVDQYNQLKSDSQGSDQLKEIARNAVAGRVKTLLVEEDKIIPGRIDGASGTIKEQPLEKPNVDDLLDDLGELVLKMGGDVHLVKPELMPTDTGAAAMYRY
jgi:hypothetical protein